MQIRPIILLQDIEMASLDALKSVAALGWPVIANGLDLQKSLKTHELLPVFGKDQLQILSVEVEDDRSLFSLVVEQAINDEKTHLFVISAFQESFLSQLETLPKKLTENPFHYFFFTSDEKSKRKNNGLMQRLLDLEEQDYRSLITPTAVYPLFHIQNLKLEKKSLFQTEKLLIHCLSKKHHWISIPCLKPSEKAKKVSLMQKTTQSFYDWWLVALSSFHRAQSPWHSALSFGVGAFLACTPFYGLQTGLIILFCLVFRLSFPVAFLGSQISIPPIYSLLVPLQLYVGFQLTNTPFQFDGPWLELAQNHFIAWLIGSLIVGGVISVAMAVVWYWLQKGSSRKNVNWTGRMRGGKLGNAFLISLLRLFGLRFGYLLLYFIVPYFYVFAPQSRRGLSEYYKVVSPGVGFWSRQKNIFQHLMCFAKTLMDQAFQAQNKNLSFNIEYERGNALKEHHSEGARLMLFSHFGGWGLSTQGFSRRETQKPIHLIRYSTDSLSSEKVIQEKNKTNLSTIYIKPGEPVFMAIHQVLREKGHLAIMGDRPFDNNFELKKLLGRLAPIPSTPFRLAKTYKAKVSFVMGFRKGFKHYGLATETFDMEELLVEEAMEKYLNFLTEYLEKYPKQWFNLYSYWSQIPTLPNGESCRPQKNVIQSFSFENVTSPQKQPTS